jgi:phage terminase large subunit
VDDAAQVVIPYTPREIFVPYHNRTQRWSVEVDHRRCGKTVSRVNELIKSAMTCTKDRPRFAYVAPWLKQAKGVAWDYLKSFSAPLLKHGATFNESELRVDYPNGAQIRLYGADNPDAMRGIYLDGLVLDEFGDMDPGIWPVVRPALSDRIGWADFIGTPKGKNEFWRIYSSGVNDPEWYAAMHKASETGLIPQAELDAARKSLTEDQYNQEYECSFDAAIQGAYYGVDMANAEKDKRIGKVPWERDIEVTTAWDLGIGDSTSIWFVQQVANEIRVIDYLEASGAGLDHYARELKAKPYVYGRHILPHDVEVHELTTGKSRKESLASMGIQATVAPKLPVDDGINAVRRILHKCWFDADKCARGIEALKQYRREWDDKGRMFRNRPLHDWTSHGADAFRYLAVGLPDDMPVAMPQINLKWVA